MDVRVFIQTTSVPEYRIRCREADVIDGGDRTSHGKCKCAVTRANGANRGNGATSYCANIDYSEQIVECFLIAYTSLHIPPFRINLQHMTSANTYANFTE